MIKIEGLKMKKLKEAQDHYKNAVHYLKLQLAEEFPKGTLVQRTEVNWDKTKTVRRAVVNGYSLQPGALVIQYEDGITTNEHWYMLVKVAHGGAA